MNIWKRIHDKTFQAGECKIWFGATVKGRPVVFFNGKMRYVTRVIKHLKGELDLDSDVQVLHIVECNNPKCVEDKHLYLGDNAQNASDRSEINTHCPQGHEFTPSNTMIDSGYKRCRICHNRKRA
jgi:hypothetical protein